jgi:hypothetical protein
MISQPADTMNFKLIEPQIKNIGRIQESLNYDFVNIIGEV